MEKWSNDTDPLVVLYDMSELMKERVSNHAAPHHDGEDVKQNLNLRAYLFLDLYYYRILSTCVTFIVMSLRNCFAVVYSIKLCIRCTAGCFVTLSCGVPMLTGVSVTPVVNFMSVILSLN